MDGNYSRYEENPDNYEGFAQKGSPSQDRGAATEDKCKKEKRWLNLTPGFFQLVFDGLLVIVGALGLVVADRQLGAMNQ